MAHPFEFGIVLCHVYLTFIFLKKAMQADAIDEFQFPSDSEGFKEIVREFSQCGHLVMIVGIRPDERYTYALYFWDTTDYEYSGTGWAPCGAGGIYSDMNFAIDEARKLLLALGTHGEI